MLMKVSDITSIDEEIFDSVFRDEKEKKVMNEIEKGYMHQFTQFYNLEVERKKHRIIFEK